MIAIGKEIPLPTIEVKTEAVFYPCLSAEEVLSIIAHNFEQVPISVEKFGSGKHVIIILPDAMAVYEPMVGWGRRTPYNADEQLYQGIGHVFVDRFGNVTHVITHFIYVYAAHRSPVSACVFQGSYDSIMERISLEREIYNKNALTYNLSPQGFKYDPFVEKYGKCILDLWGHTHTGIGVFFSPDDRGSGIASSSLPAVTFVADPIRKEMKAMVGVEQEDARIICLRYLAVPDAEKETDAEVKTYQNMTVKEAYEDILVCCNVINASDEVATCKVSERKSMDGTLEMRASMKWKPYGRKRNRHKNRHKGKGRNHEFVT